MTNPLDNPIGFLQEFCQKHRADTFPSYQEVGVSGPDHCRKFSIKCEYGDLEVIGMAHQKKQAKYEAAKLMYQLLKQDNYFDKFNKGTKSENMGNGYSENTFSKNPISALQEHCQASNLIMPNYFETAAESAGFVCRCSVLERQTYGHGSTKKAAKTEAAYKMCLELKLFAPMKKEESEVDEEVDEKASINKNPISILQEICSKRSHLPNPVYESKGFFLGSFVIVCHVGTISAEGKDTTKKGAKIHAANQVLEMLLASETARTGIPYQPFNNNIVASHECSLEEFKLDSDEEDEDAQSKDDQSVLSMSKQLDSLSLDAGAVGNNPEAAVVVKVEGDHSAVNEISQQNDVDSQSLEDKMNESHPSKNVECSEDQADEISRSENKNQVGSEELPLPREE